MTYYGDYDADYQRLYRVLYNNRKSPGITLEDIVVASGVRRGHIHYLLSHMYEDGFDIYANERIHWSGIVQNYYRLAL